MSPKNDKYPKVLFGLLQSVLFKSSIWSTLVLFGLHWFYWVYSFKLVLFYLLRSYFVCIGHIQSIPFWFYLVHICPNSDYSVNLGPIQSTLVLFRPLWSYSVHFGHIQFYLFLFGPCVHFGPNVSIRSYLVHFSPPCSHLVLFYPFNLFGPLVSTSVHFMHLHIRNRYVWVEITYSKSIYIYIYIYIYISNS